MEQLDGIVEHFVFRAPETGYAVLNLRVRKGKHDLHHTVTGAFPAVEIGDRVVIEGNWQDHPKYGHQFKAHDFTLKFGEEGLFRFLCQLEQVGPVRARKIMKHFGDDVLDVITNQPERLLEINGITADRISTIQMMYEKMHEEQDVLLFLQSLKLSPKQIGKLMHAYGSSVRQIIEENPFLLVGGEVSVSFRMADEIRERVGLPADSPLRIRAGCQHVMRNVQGQGHAYLAYDEFLGDVSRLLDLTTEQVKDELPAMKRKSLLFIEKDRVYGPLLYWAEHEVARAVKRLKEEG